MATRSNIWIELNYQDSEKYTSNYMGIYCHLDGYLDGVGYTLLEEYNSYDKALNLILKGNLSSLVEKPVPYNEEYSLSNEVFQIGGPDFIYLFKNGKWHYIESENFKKEEMKDLEKEMCWESPEVKDADFEYAIKKCGITTTYDPETNTFSKYQPETEEKEDESKEDLDEKAFEKIEKISDKFDELGSAIQSMKESLASINKSLESILEKF